MQASAVRDRMGQLFPVLAYSPEDHLFILEKSSLGFGFMCSPLTGSDDRMFDRFNNLLNLSWPAGTILQFCLWASPDLMPERILLSGVDEDAERISEVLQEVRAKRVDYLRQGADVPFDGSGLMLRDIKLLITARLPLAQFPPVDKESRETLELRDAAVETLKSCGFRPQLLNVEDYIRFMETILNWSPAAGWRQYTTAQFDPGRLIQDQLADFETELQVHRDHLRLGDKVVKLLSPKRIPETTYLGLAQRYLIDPLTGSRGIRGNILITGNLYFPDTERRRGKLDNERKWVTNQAYGPLLKFVPRLGKKKESYDILFESLDTGDRLVKLMLSAALFCDPEAVSGAVANLQAFWRESGIQLLEDGLITLPLFLNSLPFGAEPEVVDELNRYRTLGSRQSLVFLPIFGGWKGTGTPAMQFIGRDGQLGFFDLFDSTTNYNAVIAAQSGSGKSFLTNEIIMQYLSLGGRAWVLDIGRSYEKLAKVLGETFMVFGADSDICLNPFGIVQDYNEDADTLAGLVTAMAAPTVPLDDFQSSGLRRVLNKVWQQEGQEMSIDSLARALKAGDEDARINDIGHQLYPFTSQGEYGRFFNGPNNVDFQGRLIVIELEELRGRKQLQQVVLLQLIYQIQQEMYLGERDRRKIVIIDEAWDLLTQGNVGKFIEHGYRRFRKYGGAAVVITQSINDLYNSPSGEAIAENSAIKILLGQAPETIMKLEKDGRMDVGGEFGFALLKSLHTVPGKYSELCFVTQQGIGVERLYVEPFKQLLYSTKADDINELKQLQEQGLSLMKAISSVMAARGMAA
ncbi:MAG: type IV secretion system protein TraC [Desulfobaccales bacterium]